MGVYTALCMYSQYIRLIQRFAFDESQTVDFSDIFDFTQISNISKGTKGKLNRAHSDLNTTSHSTDSVVNGSNNRRRLIQPRDDMYLDSSSNTSTANGSSLSNALQTVRCC